MIDQPLHQLITLPHREIVPSKTQPRTHFAPEKMAELKASLAAHGFTPALSHLLVRPFEYRWEPAHDPRNGMVFEVRTHETSPWQRVRVRFDVPKASEEGAPGWAILQTEEDVQTALRQLPKYEVVCGERRWRGSGELIAEGKLPDQVPAVIEEMSDARALELQLIENLQREDLSPLEEAEGIVRLLELRDPSGEPLYTRETLAAKLGCTEQHVGNQRRIARLRGTPIGEALEAGKLTGTHARILSGVPAGPVRDELTKRVLAPGGPMPTRLLERVIQDEFMVELRGADFDTEDPNLVPVLYEGGPAEYASRLLGGACGDCPFNSKNAGGTDKMLMCMNPECFRMKTAAAHEDWRQSVKVREAREAALSIEEAAKVFDYSGRKLNFNSGYVELDAAPDESELRAGVQSPGNWRKLIKGQGVPVFYAKDSAHKVHEIVARDLARKAAHLNGHEIFKDSEQQSRLDDEKPGPLDGGAGSLIIGVTDEEHAEETLGRKAEQEAKRALHDAEMGAIVASAEKSVRASHVTLPTAAWTVMVLGIAEVLNDYGALVRILARRQGVIGLEENLSMVVSKWTIAQKVGFIVEALIALSIDEDEAGDWAVWAKPFGVDLKSVRKKAAKANVPRPTEEKKIAA
jgi:ParB/RepB/Spo0J family partition protein